MTVGQLKSMLADSTKGWLSLYMVLPIQKSKKSVLSCPIEKQSSVWRGGGDHFCINTLTIADSLKINFKAHSYKSCNLIMTLDRDDEWLLLDDNKVGCDFGLKCNFCRLLKKEVLVCGNTPAVTHYILVLFWGSFLITLRAWDRIGILWYGAL